MFIWGIT